MNSIHTNFYKLPNKIYELDLSANELVILMYLFSISRKRGIDPSKQTIATKTGLSRRTVDRIIKLLVNKGFLEYKKGFKSGNLNVCNKYCILIDKIDPDCTRKSPEQIEREAPAEEECSEMIMESMKEYNS